MLPDLYFFSQIWQKKCPLLLSLQKISNAFNNLLIAIVPFPYMFDCQMGKNGPENEVRIFLFPVWRRKKKQSDARVLYSFGHLFIPLICSISLLNALAVRAVN